MLTLLVLAAGKGTRMRSELPKVLHPLLGAPMLEYAFDKARGIEADHFVGVIGYGREKIEAAFQGRDATWAIQSEQKGTGHAAHVGVEALFEKLGDGASSEDVLIINGDLPLLGVGTLKALVDAHRHRGAEVSVLTRVKEDPTGFGRIVRDGGDHIARIVEQADASPEERAIREVNVGTYVFRGESFRKYYERIRPDNEQGEYYLTDVVVEAARDGARVASHEVVDEVETEQVNSQRELAHVTGLLREQIVVEHLERGVKIDDPASAYIERDVEIGAGAHILPFCVLRRGVRIAPGCVVGPFAHLRPGTVLEDGAKVGNFVEVKNSTLGKGTKASHLSYIGDGEVGDRVNIGAGTIFANYDGKKKWTTEVDADAFIGSGSILVAPVKVGKKGRTAAGAVVLSGRDVDEEGLVGGVPAKPLRRDAPSTASDEEPKR